jgi:hypothetical protein
VGKKRMRLWSRDVHAEGLDDVPGPVNRKGVPGPSERSWWNLKLTRQTLQQGKYRNVTAQHCPHLMLWRGRFKDGAAKWHTVKACDGHRADLDAVQRSG